MNCPPADQESPVDLSIVVPLFNEEESVAALIESIDQSLQPFCNPPSSPTGHGGSTVKLARRRSCEVLLVDDGSLDGTVRCALDAASKASIPVQVISLQRNFGQTAAMQAGIDAAKGELIATLDGDLQNDPADIVKMVEHLETEDLDLLVGRRKKRQDGLVLRKVPSWIANRLIGYVTGVRIRDYGCSLKIYRAAVVKRIRLMGEMHRFIPCWVASVTHPSRIGEIDVNHRARQFGESKYGISRTIRVLIDLLSVMFFLKYRARPGHFFGTLGLLVGLVGSAMLSAVMVAKFGLGQDIGTRPMLLLGAFAILSSLQLLCFGVMAEMLSRIYNESTGHSMYVVRDVQSVDADAAESQPLRRAG